jgi:hypothetical protein
MRLTSQQFSEILNGLRRGEPSSPSGAEKRKFTRLRIQVMVEIIGISAGLPRKYSALTRDISFGGVGLLQTIEPSPGAQIVICLPAGRTGFIPLLCAVTNSHCVAQGLFSVGAEFITVATRELLEHGLKADEAEVERIRRSIIGE